MDGLMDWVSWLLSLGEEIGTLRDLYLGFGLVGTRIEKAESDFYKDR